MDKKELVQLVDNIKGYVEVEKMMGVSCFFRGGKIEEKKVLLKKIEEEVKDCKKCALYKTRKNIVFGEGHPSAKIFFLGEAPGEEEDIEGKPFVGKAGKLLTQIIEAMGFKREDVYIANVLKCRPPNNRAPYLEEIDACFGFLKRQIEIIRPWVICALGRFANLALSKKDLSLTKVHGEEYLYEGIKVIPTFHPAYLLRNPQEKKSAWQDFKKVIKIIRV